MYARWALSTSTAFTAGFVVAASAQVAEPATAASPGYRLSGEVTEQFRFARQGANLSSALLMKDKAVPAHLAGTPFAAQIYAAARKSRLDPALVHALIFVESGYNPMALSPKGAVGLMQLMPETARRYGVTKAVHDPEANLRAGTRYLSDLIALFDSRLDLALAAYNAGESAVIKYGMRIPPYQETLNYVPAVLAKYRELREAGSAHAKADVTYMPGTRLNPESLRVLK